MKAGYYKDSMHNYMVLLSGEENESEDYRYRMITRNRISGILPVSIRYIDGKRYLYYEITSRQSLDTLLNRQSLALDELEAMMASLVDVKERLSEYLLDPTGLLLAPEYIFYDLREKTYLYTYFPGSGEGTEEKTTERDFFRELTLHVEKDNREAIRFMYRLCALAENPEYTLRREDLYDSPLYGAEENVIAKKSSHLAENGASEKSGFSAEDEEFGNDRFSDGYSDRFMDRKEISGNRAENRSGGRATDINLRGRSRESSRRFGSAEEDPVRDSGTDGGTNPGKEQATGGRAGKRISLIPLIFWGAAAFLLILRCTVNMNNKGGKMCMAAVIIGALLGTLLFYAEKREAEAEEAEEDEAVQLTEPGERQPTGKNAGRAPEMDLRKIPESRSGSLSSVQVKNEVRNREWNGSGRPAKELTHTGNRGFLRACDEAPDPSGLRNREKNRPEELLDVETVYLTHSPEPIYRLCGTGRWSGTDIELDSLPCVVGKLGKYVDVVVDDRSVSRIHAEISEDAEGHLVIKDLNSTNGTWIGRRRLEPNESALLTENETLRFGRVEFKLRET